MKNSFPLLEFHKRFFALLSKHNIHINVCECSLLYKNVNCTSFLTYPLTLCLTIRIASICGDNVEVCLV